MRPLLLLNFSTHPHDLSLFHGNWQALKDFVWEQGLDGIELYPVQDVDTREVPSTFVKGVHLRFFIFIRHLWNQDRAGLLRLFGSMEHVKRFYGGTGKEAILDTYRRQLDLAQALGASYVVFHPADISLENVFDWGMETQWMETLELSCDIIQSALETSSFTGHVLFENLWWPGSFTLTEIEEFQFILKHMGYERCGIVLDTGHLLLAGGGFDKEVEAISYLMARAEGLEGLKPFILAIHLTNTLSGEYVRVSRAQKGRRPKGNGFWDRLMDARRHVERLDLHDAFTRPEIEGFLKKLSPGYIVFEFRYKDLHTWREKIALQKRAIEGFMRWKESP